MQETTSPLQSVIDQFGNRNRLAKKLGISRQAVCKWKVVPINRLKQISELTGFSVSQMRPDIFNE